MHCPGVSPVYYIRAACISISRRSLWFVSRFIGPALKTNKKQKKAIINYQQELAPVYEWSHGQKADNHLMCCMLALKLRSPPPPQQHASKQPLSMKSLSTRAIQASVFKTVAFTREQGTILRIFSGSHTVFKAHVYIFGRLNIPALKCSFIGNTNFF